MHMADKIFDNCVFKHVWVLCEKTYEKILETHRRVDRGVQHAHGRSNFRQLCFQTCLGAFGKNLRTYYENSSESRSGSPTCTWQI